MQKRVHYALTILFALYAWSPAFADQLASTSNDTFKKDVLLSTTPVVVAFVADWSNYCKTMTPTLESLAKTYVKRASFYTVDIDKEPQLKAQYRVRGIPRVIVFNKGEPVTDTTGPNDGKVISAKLDEIVSSKIPVVDDNF